MREWFERPMFVELSRGACAEVGAHAFAVGNRSCECGAVPCPPQRLCSHTLFDATCKPVLP